MRELKIRIGIDDKTNKVLVVEEQMLGIPPGIDKELYLLGIYQYLINRRKSIQNECKAIFKKQQDKKED